MSEEFPGGGIMMILKYRGMGAAASRSQQVVGLDGLVVKRGNRWTKSHISFLRAYWLLLRLFDGKVQPFNHSFYLVIVWQIIVNHRLNAL